MYWNEQYNSMITIGLCQKCFTSGVSVTLTKIGEKEGMVTSIAVCEKCKK